MDAAYPAAWASLAFGEFGVSALDATIARIDQLGVFDPANPLIACQWCNVIPSRKPFGVVD